MAQTLLRRSLVAGRTWWVCALLMAGCDLNPRGELPSGDQGGPPQFGDTPSIPIGPDEKGGEPGYTPVPLPQFPFPQGAGEAAESAPNDGDVPAVPTDAPIAPPDSEPADDQEPEPTPIYSDAGVVAEDDADWDTEHEDRGSDAGATWDSTEIDTEIDTDSPANQADASAVWPAADAGLPSMPQVAPADGGTDGGSDAGLETSAGDGGLNDAGTFVPDGGPGDSGTSSSDAGADDAGP